MQTHRVVLLALALWCLTLAGCSEQRKIDKLEAENSQLQQQLAQIDGERKQLKKQLDDDYSRRVAEFNQGEHLAGISLGCRVIFNVCPSAVLAPGDLASKNGYSGGGTLVYWSISLTKCLFFMGLIWGSLALWTKRMRPDLNAQRLAEQDLEQALADLKEVNSSLQKAKFELLQIEASREQSSEILNILQAEASLLGEKVAELDKAAASKKSMLTALNSFNFKSS